MRTSIAAAVPATRIGTRTDAATRVRVAEEGRQQPPIARGGGDNLDAECVLVGDLVLAERMIAVAHQLRPGRRAEPLVLATLPQPIRSVGSVEVCLDLPIA